jgi:transglutaminase-like putative cysteine protease
MQNMRALVQQAVRDPAQAVRETAMRIIGDAGWVDQARALQSWVNSRIRYIRDPPDMELVQTPQYTMQQRGGDCDDQATLLAALLTSIGHPARFVALGFQGQPLSHVMVQTLVGQSWAGAETIIPKPFGWMPPGVTSHYIVKV